MTPSESIHADLRKQILTGKLRPGDRLPTEKELAKQYGVAVMTVRQAQHPLLQEGLIRKQRRHGTFVCEDAAKHRRMLLVCGIRPNGHGQALGVSQYYQDSIRFCHEAVMARGLTLETYWEYGESIFPLESVGRERLVAASGVIFLGCPHDDQLVRVAQRERMHAVHLGKTQEAERAVWFDLQDAASIAIGRIYPEIRRRRLSVVVGSVEGDERGATHCARVFAGRTVNMQLPSHLTLWDTECYGYRAIRRLCEQSSEPMAFVFLDDVVARGGTRALLETGFGDGRCPVAIVSGKQEMAHYGLPVVHVTHDTELEARWAVEMLQAQIEGREGGTAPRQSPFTLDTLPEPEREEWMEELEVGRRGNG